MDITKTIKEGLETFLKSTTDPEVIKKIGGLQAECDKVDKDYSDLETKHLKLANDYKEQVRKGVFSSEEEGTPTEGHKTKSVSFEEIADELLEKQED